MMRLTSGLCTFLIAVAGLSGCTTAKVIVPLPKVAVDVPAAQRAERVLLVVTDEFSSAFHESPQLLSVFQYDLGKYLPLAIEDSLDAQFSSVETVDTEGQSGHYDLTVKPKLISFDAPVPATVFARTKVQLEIAYHLTMPDRGKERTVTSLGDYKFRSEADEEFYNSIDTAVPDIYYYEPSSGVGANMPNYTGIAGKDVAVALKQCLEELNASVIAFLNESD